MGSKGEEEMKNKDIREGLIAGLITGLIFGLITGLMFGLTFGWIFGWIAGLIYGLIFGLFAGLNTGLIYGLITGLMITFITQLIALISGNPEFVMLDFVISGVLILLIETFGWIVYWRLKNDKKRH